MADTSAPWAPTTTYLVARTGQDQAPAYNRDLGPAASFAEYRRRLDRRFQKDAPDDEIVIVEATITYRVLAGKELRTRLTAYRKDQREAQRKEKAEQEAWEAAEAEAELLAKAVNA